MNREKMTLKEIREKMKAEPLWRFFTMEINSANRKIAENKKKIKTLAREQEALKRGRAELVRLRRML